MTSDEYVRPFPRVVRIEPAGACNLSCSHCPTGTVPMVRGIMRPPTFARVLDAVTRHIDAVKVAVLYHGGEPLLNKRFPEMVRQLKTIGVPFVKTVSNGMLLSEATLAGIVDHGLDAIEFSLDAESPAQNNFVRRDCDYETVVGNVKRLIEYKWAHAAATPRIFISSTQFLRPEAHRTRDQQPEVPAYLAREFSGKYAGAIEAFKCAWAMRWPHMEVLEDIYDVYHDPYDTETSNACDHVEHTVTVRWNGDVVACCYDLTSRYVLGNVEQEDLAAIWNNRRYRALRRSIETMKFIPLCANCNVVKPNVYLTLKPEVRARLGGTIAEWSAATASASPPASVSA